MGLLSTVALFYSVNLLGFYFGLVRSKTLATKKVLQLNNVHAKNYIFENTPVHFPIFFTEKKRF